MAESSVNTSFGFPLDEVELGLLWQPMSEFFFSFFSPKVYVIFSQVAKPKDFALIFYL